MPVRIQRKRAGQYNPKRIKAWRASPDRPRAKCHPDKPHRARGLCDACYDRWLYGTSKTYKAGRRKSAKNWSNRYPERKANSNERARLKRRYGLTPEEVEVMRGAQKGQCAICKSELPLAIDHCHTTGKVRGLLCLPCNGSLAFVERMLRNDQWVQDARKYLER